MRKYFSSIGWILFTLGSLIFLIDNIVQENILGAIGSGVFFVACIIFMIGEKE